MILIGVFSFEVFCIEIGLPMNVCLLLARHTLNFYFFTAEYKWWIHFQHPHNTSRNWGQNFKVYISSEPS